MVLLRYRKVQVTHRRQLVGKPLGLPDQPQCQVQLAGAIAVQQILQVHGTVQDQIPTLPVVYKVSLTSASSSPIHSIISARYTNRLTVVLKRVI